MDIQIEHQLNTLTEIIKDTVPVEQIYLFGSYAQGTPRRESDLDIYVVMRDSSNLREIDAMYLIQKAILGNKSMPVDVLVGKKQKYLERVKGPTIEKSIADEGVLLYQSP